MKKFITLLLLLFPAIFVLAQRPLTDSRTNSPYTYIYRLDDASTLLFLTGKEDQFKDEALKDLVFKYKTNDDVTLNLAPGNYLQVSAENNKMSYELIQKHSATFKQLINSRDISFILLDTAHREIKDAQVYVGKKPVIFDAQTQSYHFKQTKRDTLIKAVYQGVNNFSIVGLPDYQNNYYRNRNEKKPGFWAKLTKPVHQLFKRDKEVNNYFRGSNNPGFMIFNKPKYKEGDTVKFKAYILQPKSKKPINDTRLLIRLLERHDDEGKIIGYVNAYRKGGFEYQFKLTDSLDLNLDADYILSLEPLKNAKADNADKAKKQADNDNPKQVRYMVGDFRYEDYELKSSKFTVRVDGREQSPGIPVPFYFKALDENGLNVPDGRVRIIVKASQADELLNNYEFVPDTLAKFEIALDAVGETKFVIPDSIFPKAKLDFYVLTTFLNSSNESREDDKYLKWDYHNKKLVLKAGQDTLAINYMVSGKPMPAKATLSERDAVFDLVKTTTINLPAKIQLNPTVSIYEVAVDSLEDELRLRQLKGNLEPTGYRTADSLFLKVENPRKLKFWYTVFGGNKVIDQGSTTELNYKRPYKSLQSVSLLVSYVWAGQSQFNEQRIPYQDRVLNIDVKEPQTIYPGQQTEIEAAVTDNKGKPVAGADITAYGITSKFEQYGGPALPYLGKIYPDRKLKNGFVARRFDDKNGSLKLNWQRWGSGLGLDTIKYFQFTHPQQRFEITEPTPDHVTQLAPFVMKDGVIQPVHILYIDGLPVFFDQSQELPQYSFAVDTGWHTIKMRTKNHLIRLDGVKVPAGKKLILSVNADTLLNRIAGFTPMPDTLTNDESRLMSKYMIGIVPNFGINMAGLEQKGRIHLINPEAVMYNHNGRTSQILAGPFLNDDVQLNIKDGLSRSFTGEGGYSFEFTDDLTKQRPLPGKYPFLSRFNQWDGNNNYRQYALSNKGVDTVWRNFLETHVQQAYYNDDFTGGNGRLSLKTGKAANGKYLPVKAILVFKNDDPGHLHIMAGGHGPDVFSCEPGDYRVLYLFKGNSYYVQQNIIVKSGGINYYNTGAINPHAPDSLSNRIGQILNDRILGASIAACNEAIRETFYTRYLDVSFFKKEMTGRVFNVNNKKALAGITVSVAGTPYKTLTVEGGFFRLKVPGKGKIKIESDTYLADYVNIQTDSAVVVYLQPNEVALREAKILGYTRRVRMQTTGATTIITARETVNNPSQLLQGKVAGLNIQNNTGAPGIRGSVNIRGLSTVGNFSLPNNPLYIVDGVAVSGNPLTEIAQEEIASMEILKDAAATAIYGVRGAGGVVLIMTVKGRDKMQAGLAGGASFRHNFSDYAYWQPKLTTDVNGKVKFKVTYPDDITAWRTFMVGVTDDRQTGFTEGKVKAFKPVSANFNSPQFAVRGDSFSPLGKLLNYTADTIQLNRKFVYNGKVIAEQDLTVKTSRIDTFKLVADGSDTLKFEYSLKRGNGYFDGEQREIPVFEQGSLETKGSFNSLEKDTTISLSFDPNLKEVTLRAEGSVLPVLLDEAEHLRNYEYLCNEQLASKLKGLLAAKQIKEYLKEPFKWDANIKDLIKKLVDSRRMEGTWGWWKDTPGELWISLHVTEALLAAEAKKFAVPINKSELANYLLYQATSYKGRDKLTMVKLLKMLKSGADLKAIVTGYEKQSSAKEKQSNADKYQLMLSRQLAGMPIEIDTLLKGMQRTMFGNVYWGEPGYNFFNNSIQLSLTVYQVLKNEGKHPELLAKLRNYFMEQRGDGNWRNTYESAQILETILPDLLVNGEQPKPASITITGDKTETITKFPYQTKLSADAKITVKKAGNLPVYLSTYQKFWNPAPAKVSTDFTVDTWFNNGQSKVTKAKGGEAITLTAEVTARADADFVMVEIPIPAGCSYDGKPQSYYGNEVHREYFKNKVSIFCRKLTAGKYTFTVKLMPRYSGNYHINPAKAEMMYFPVFYGREGMKMFEIE